MISKIKTFFDRSFWIFLLIGAGNTVISLALQYTFYNLLKLGYWPSTAIPYVICSIISFFLNKKFSFKNEDNILIAALKFALVIAVCYLIAFSVAQPFTAWVIQSLGIAIEEDMINNIAIFVGQCVFTLLNYTGQRFFAFRKKKEDKQSKNI